MSEFIEVVKDDENRFETYHKISVAPNNRLLAYTTETTLCVWDLCKSCKLWENNVYENSKTPIMWAPDSTEVCLVSYAGSIRIFKADDGDCRLKFTDSRILNADWSPNGKFIVAVCFRNFLSQRNMFVLDVEKDPPQIVWTLSDVPKVHVVKWSHNGKSIATGSKDGIVRIYDFENHMSETVLSVCPGQRVTNFDWSCDDTQLAICPVQVTEFATHIFQPVQVWALQCKTVEFYNVYAKRVLWKDKCVVYHHNTHVNKCVGVIDTTTGEDTILYNGFVYDVCLAPCEPIVYITNGKSIIKVPLFKWSDRINWAFSPRVRQLVFHLWCILNIMSTIHTRICLDLCRHVIQRALLK